MSDFAAWLTDRVPHYGVPIRDLAELAQDGVEAVGNPPRRGRVLTQLAIQRVMHLPTYGKNVALKGGRFVRELRLTPADIASVLWRGDNGAKVGVKYLSQNAALLKGATMVPDILNCTQCGRPAVVLSWSPVRDDTMGQAALDDSQMLIIFCKIDCSTCGPRIQSTAPPRDGSAVA